MRGEIESRQEGPGEPGSGSAPAPTREAVLRAGVLAGLVSAMLFGGGVVPLAAAPVVVAHRRWGRRAAVAAVAVGTLVSAGVAGGSAGALGFGASAGLMGWLLAEAWRRADDPVRAIALSALVYSGGMITLAYGLAAAEGRPLAGWVREALSAALAREPSVAGGAAPSPADLDRLAEWAGRLLPGLTTAGSTVVLWLDLLVARWFLPGARTLESLLLFRLPMPATWGFMAFAVPVIAWMGPWGASLPAAPVVVDACLNVLLVLATLYALQGVAVSSWFIRRLAPGPASQAALSAVQVLTLLLFPFPFLAVGLFDPWFDFRKATTPNPDRPGGP